MEFQLDLPTTFRSLVDKKKDDAVENYLSQFISDDAKTKQMTLFDGYVRSIEKSLHNQIIPRSVVFISFQFYYVSLYIIARTGLQAISVETMKRWKCSDFSEINALSQCEIAEEVIDYLEGGTTLV